MVTNTLHIQDAQPLETSNIENKFNHIQLKGKHLIITFMNHTVNLASRHTSQCTQK